MSKLPPLDIWQKFGDWTVIAQLEYAEIPKIGYSRVRCVCGTEKDMINNRLRKGNSNGCGCSCGRASLSQKKLVVGAKDHKVV